ncbi:MAG: Do family serine endopeptidase [Rickettsiales bacterium]|nr:Do family serine endopeptidase [Rickettsiales bacterium]
MSKKGRVSNLRVLFVVVILTLLWMNVVYASPKMDKVSTVSNQSPLCNVSNFSKQYVLNGFADIVAPLMPAVVNISTVQKPRKVSKDRMIPSQKGSPFEELFPFLEKHFPPGMFNDDSFENNRKLISLGSGFIIDKTGYVVTNYHVIAEASEITVKLHNGTSIKAKVIGVDQATDVALLKINSKKPLAFAKFGNSDTARVGDWVIAVGNPFGLGNTVTTGIVSANGRDISSEGVVDNFIQTDAAINRGNSGGPMFNIRGEVIGMNTQILSPSGVNIGIGFATPSSIIEPIIKQLKTTGKVVSAFLGIRMQMLTEDLAESMGMEDAKGALVVGVEKNTPAEKAGIMVGDVIISFNKKKVKSFKELQRIVRNSPIDKPIPMSVLRNRKSKTLTVKLAEASKGVGVLDKFKEKFKGFSEFSSYKDILGAMVSKLDDKLRNKFGIDNSVNGLILLDVKRDSLWAAQGFMVGDVLLRVNGEVLSDVSQLEKIIKASKSDNKKSIFFLVQKKNMRMFMPFILKVER